MEKSEPKIKLYKSLDTISVYLFFKILNTSDYSYLIKKRSKYKNKLSKLKLIELENVFKDIIIEYSKATNNFKFINDIKKKLYISKLEYEFSLISSVLKIFEEYEEFEVLTVLNEMGFNFKKSTNTEDEIKKVLIKCKSLKNKINIAKLNYNKNNKSKNSKEDNTYNLDSMALNLERALDLKYKLDVMCTSMLRWVNLIELSKKNKNG